MITFRETSEPHTCPNSNLRVCSSGFSRLRPHKCGTTNNQCGTKNTARPQRQGIALIMVLIVVAILSLGAYTFSDLMVAEWGGATVSGRQAQARAATESAAELAAAFFLEDEATRFSAGGVYDNPAYFSGIPVTGLDDPVGSYLCSVFTSALDDYGAPSGIRFGMEDESTRLNLNTLLQADEQAPAQASEADAGAEEGADQEAEAEDDTASDDPEAFVTSPAREMLMMLPGMTDNVADAILDWLDEDSIPREFGAEAETYSLMGYEPANGPIKSLDELLLVAGVTPELLYGADRNRNGLIDSNEQELSMAYQIDPARGSLDRGWSAYLTIYSKERNVDSDGLPRINMNGEDMQALYDELVTVFDPDWATFIVAYRQNGPYQENAGGNNNDGNNSGGNNSGGNNSGGNNSGGNNSGGNNSGGNNSGGNNNGGNNNGGNNNGGNNNGGNNNGGNNNGGNNNGGNNNGGNNTANNTQTPEIQAIDGRSVDLTSPGQTEIAQVLDLIGARVQVTFEGEEEPVIVESPFAEDPVEMGSYLPDLMDRVTVVADEVIPGRVNINQAPLPVLSAIPGMTSDVANQIMALRDATGTSTDVSFQTPAWILSQGLVSLEEMKALLPFMTAGGDVYRAQVVGYSDESGVSARAEIVVDATPALPRIVSWRDVSHLGRGLALDQQ